VVSELLDQRRAVCSSGILGHQGQEDLRALTDVVPVAPPQVEPVKLTVRGSSPFNSPNFDPVY
jgi:hypothetical protein